MKVLSKIVLATLVGGLIAFGAGCGQEGLPAGKSPEDVIKEALLNQQEINKAVYEVKIDADIKGEVDGEKNELKGSASMKGSSNTGTNEHSMIMSVDGKMNDESLKASLEVRSTQEGLFIKLDRVDLSNAEMQAMIDLFIADYKSKWTKLAFAQPEDANIAGVFQIDYSEGEELPFKNIEYKGTKDILGLKSYVFSAKVDNDKLISMMAEKGQGMADAEEVLKDADISAEVYTAVKENMLSGFAITAKLSQQELNGTMSMAFMINPTKANPVSTPKHEKELTEDDLAGLFGGGFEADYDYDYDYGDYEFDDDLEGYEFTDDELEALMGDLEIVQ